MPGNSILWTRIFINDYLGRTRTLSPAATGAYTRIVLMAIGRGARAPNDDPRLAQWAGIPLGIWRPLRAEIENERLWTVVNDELADDLVDDRLAQYRKIVRQRSLAGKASAKARHLRLVPGGDS